VTDRSNGDLPSNSQKIADGRSSSSTSVPERARILRSGISHIDKTDDSQYSRRCLTAFFSGGCHKRSVSVSHQLFCTGPVSEGPFESEKPCLLTRAHEGGLPCLAVLRLRLFGEDVGFGKACACYIRKPKLPLRLCGFARARLLGAA